MRERSVALLASASRAACVGYMLLADMLLPDHKPEGVLSFDFPPVCHLSRRTNLLAAFTRWDSAHFLEAAANGWNDPQRVYSHAFFPLYPLLVRWLARLLEPLLVSPSLLCAAELRVASGVLVSNGAFVVAACCLHRLGTRVLRDAALARTAAHLFCIAPASVFFSTVYSESLFAAATFGGLLLLESGAPWRAALCLFLASGCRGNGVLNVLPVLCLGIHRVACELLPRRSHGMGGLDGGRTCGVAEDSGLPTAGGPQGGPLGGPLGSCFEGSLARR